MSYRVVQWATGGVGRAAIEAIADRPDLKLVGCWVHGADKEGRDAGAIAGCGDLGVAATRDAEALLGLGADCVLYSPVIADTAVLERILRSGANVVTPLGWFYPPDSDETRRLEQACLDAGVSLHGTGIHPGGITERFPLMLSALSRAITHVRAEEFSDIRTYGAPDVVRDIMQFGAPPDAAMASPMVRFLGIGFVQSLRMVGDTLGFALDPQPDVLHEVAVATAPIDSPIGVIEPGTVAAQRFAWRGTAGGEPVVTAAVNWLMGDRHLDPPWTFGPRGVRFEIEITGDPSVEVVFHGLHPDSISAGLVRNAGIVATAVHCVSAIPAVCDAAPGIRTYLDLPLVAGRAAPRR
jgi:hypothetical protein